MMNILKMILALDSSEARKQMQQLGIDVDDLSKKLKSADKETIKMLNDARKSARAAQEAARNTTKMMNMMAAGFSSGSGINIAAFTNKFAMLQTAANIAGDAIAYNVQTAALFELSMAKLESITGASSDVMDYLSERAIEMGRTTTQTASLVADAFVVVGLKAPSLLDDAEALANVTDSAIILAQAAGMDVPEAATALTNVMNQFGLSANQAGTVIDMLAAGSRNGAGDIQYLGTSMVQCGAICSNLNVPVEDSIAALEELAKAGVLAGQAGRQMKNILLALETKQDVDALKPSVVGLEKAFENLAKADWGTKKMKDVFGKENITSAQYLVDHVSELDELIGKVKNSEGMAAQQSEKNTNTFQGSVVKLKSAWEGLNLSLNKSNGILKKLVDWATKGVNLITDLIGKAGGDTKTPTPKKANPKVVTAPDQSSTTTTTSTGGSGGSKKTKTTKKKDKTVWLEYDEEVKKRQETLKDIDALEQHYSKISFATKEEQQEKEAEILDKRMNAEKNFADAVTKLDTDKLITKRPGALNARDDANDRAASYQEDLSNYKDYLAKKKEELKKEEDLVKSHSDKIAENQKKGAFYGGTSGLLKIDETMSSLGIAGTSPASSDLVSKILGLSSNPEEQLKGLDQVSDAIKGRMSELQDEIYGMQDLDFGLLMKDFAGDPEMLEMLDSLQEHLKDIQGLYDELAESQGNLANATVDVRNQMKKEQKQAKKNELISLSVNSMASAFSSLGDAMGVPMLNVVGMVAQAIVSVIQGYATATALASSLGPWAWIAFAAAGLAQVAAIVALIHSLSGYAEGGIIPGSMSVGDHMLARVNAGEMILNGSLQQRLFNILDGLAGLSNEPATPVTSEVRLKGSDIYLSLKNYSKLHKTNVKF